MAKENRRNQTAGTQANRGTAAGTTLGRANYEFGTELGAGGAAGANQAGGAAGAFQAGRAQRAGAAGRQEAGQAGRRNRNGQ